MAGPINTPEFTHCPAYYLVGHNRQNVAGARGELRAGEPRGVQFEPHRANSSRSTRTH